MYESVIAELEELTMTHPLRERFYDQLMVALYRSGHQAQALGVYERARRCLADELGITPVPALNKRMQQILSHSPELTNPLTTSFSPEARRSPSITLRSGHMRPPTPPTVLPTQDRPPHTRASAPALPRGPVTSGSAACGGSDLHQLRALVEQLAAQQQVLVSTVRNLSHQLEQTMGNGENARAALSGETPRTEPPSRRGGGAGGPGHGRRSHEHRERQSQ